jgi:hypothetical protein
MIPVERGCEHSHHTYFCVETNSTFCTSCAGEEGTRVAAALQRQGGWAAVMTPVTQLKRLVDEDMSRLRVALRCVEEGVASSQRDGAHMHPELALDREAERCRSEVDAVLLRMVQHVQATRERLYREVDAAIAHRRDAVAELKDVSHKLTHSIKEVERASSLLSTSAAIDVSNDSPQPHEDITGLVAAAQLLASVEERLVLDAETALSNLFPSASSVSVTRQLARRDVMVLPTSSSELALIPFSLRLTKPLAMTSELDNIHVKDTSGWRAQDAGDSRSTSADGAIVPHSTRISDFPRQANRNGNEVAATTINTIKDGRRQAWRAYRGLDAVQARRRHIRTPDAMLL